MSLFNLIRRYPFGRSVIANMKNGLRWGGVYELETPDYIVLGQIEYLRDYEAEDQIREDSWAELARQLVIPQSDGSGFLPTDQVDFIEVLNA